MIIAILCYYVSGNIVKMVGECSQRDSKIRQVSFIEAFGLYDILADDNYAHYSLTLILT